MALDPQQFEKLKAQLTLQKGQTSALSAPQPSLQERLAAVGTSAAQNISENIAGTGQFAGQSALRRGAQAEATAFTVPIAAAKELLPAPVRGALDVAGGAIGKGFKFLTDKIGDIPALQTWVAQHPEAAKSLEDIAGTAAAVGQTAGDILAYQGAASATQKGVDLTKAGAEKVST